MSDQHDWQRERRVAESAVLCAARLTKRVLDDVAEVSKQDSSPVTVADFAAQALIISVLRAEFPDDGFLGEEDSTLLRRDASLCARVHDLLVACLAPGPKPPPSVDEMLALIDLGGRGEGGDGGRFWTMDPVDGTATFLRGEQYAVALALVDRGRQVVGVVACPNLKLRDGRVRESSVDRQGLGIMLSAVHGQGASIATLSSPDAEPVFRPLPRLEAPASPAQLHVVDCDQNAPCLRETMRDLAARLGAPFPGTDVWSSHVRYAALVVGGGHLLMRIPAKFRSRSCVWDHAGAQLIYAELGGKVTDLDGRPVDFAAGRYLSRNRGFLAAHAEIHDRVLALARELIPGEMAKPESTESQA